MIFKLTLTALFVIVLASCQNNKNTISKNRVLVLFADIKALYLAGNIDAMMDYYTDDIMVVANITRETHIKNVKTQLSLKFSKEKYKALINSIITKASAHTYDIEQLNITTEKGMNTAFASYYATEKMSLNDETIETKTFVEISITNTKSGKLLISGMTVTEI